MKTYQPITAEIIEKLKAITGPTYVKTDKDLLLQYQTDYETNPAMFHLPEAAVSPANAQEISDIVKLANEYDFPITVRSGGTSLADGAIPVCGGLVLCMDRLNKIIELNEEGMYMTVEAGVRTVDLQNAAKKVGLMYAGDPSSAESCLIGGNLATNAGGVAVLRYGPMRELTLGLEAVLPDGSVLDSLPGLRKNNTGYDLRHLLIGSEGTLGIITAATLKLFPLPRAQITAWAALPSVQAAVDLLALARHRLDAGLTGFELMNATALQLVQRHFPQLRTPFASTAPWCALLEHSVYDATEPAQQPLQDLLETALQQGLISNAVVAETVAQTHGLWQVRESIPLAQAEAGLNVKHDIAVPISAMAAFVADTGAALAAAFPGVRMITFGHLGDSNLHYNVQAPEGVDPAAFLQQHEAAINTLVLDAVHRVGGSISAEHGIGQLKRNILPRYQSPVALGMMRAIKQALDPQNIMNPGKVLPDQD